jgi:hypothetical protein
MKRVYIGYFCWFQDEYRISDMIFSLDSPFGKMIDESDLFDLLLVVNVRKINLFSEAVLGLDI